MYRASIDSNATVAVAAISVAVALAALGLGLFQEIRHWRESGQRVELDIRMIWLARGPEGIRLAIVDAIAFNPSLVGVAINHLYLRVPAYLGVVFDLARPQREPTGGWKLDSTSYDATLVATGDIDFDYGYTPWNLPPRQSENRIFGFIPVSVSANLTAADLMLVARMRSRERHYAGLLWWRKIFRRQRTSFDEVEANWNGEFVSTTDIPPEHIRGN